MRISRGWPADVGRPAAVALGNFDGVHVGHRAIVSTLRAEAAVAGLDVAVVTFDPHPLALLRPDRTPRAIDPPDVRLARLAGVGVDHVVLLRFDEALRATPAEAFAGQLMERLSATVLVASDDSRFGHGGKGDLSVLRAIGAAHGVRVLRIPAISRAGAKVSSSRVRAAVEAGDTPLAASLLQRPFALFGSVVHGDAAGRAIGFPTANLAVDGQVLPRAGVYAVSAQVGAERFDGVANLGTRPTVGGRAFRVEAHLFDFTGDLYGQRLELAFFERLRDERRFDGIDALRGAIAADCEQARRLAARRAAVLPVGDER